MSKSDTKVFSKKVHVFQAGPQTSAQGIKKNFSPQDLKEVVESYDPQIHEAPVVIGHSGDNDSVPAYGWIRGFSQDGENLYADVDFTDTAKDLVKKGHYRKVSISFYSPDSPINPHKGKWSARHLALLGAAPPAVKGLEPFSFNEENGVFDYAVSLNPSDIFDKDLGPTLLIERSPLEMLKERLEDVKNEVNSSLQQLEQNQGQQSESEADTSQSPETTNSADQNANPDNPNQQFSEMKKKLGREGAEVTESTQQMANLETKLPENKPKTTKQSTKMQMDEEVDEDGEEFKEPHNSKNKSRQSMKDEEAMESPEEEPLEDDYEEGIKRRVSNGAGGQKVQVVEQVFEEGVDSQHKETEPSSKKKTSAMMDSEDMESDAEEDEVEDDEDSSYNEPEFYEISYKTVSNGKPSFGHKTVKDNESVESRNKTARSESDSYANRQKTGKGEEGDRETLASNSGQEDDRVKTARNSEQEDDRVKTAKAKEGEDSSNGRWADQDSRKAHNDDQFDDASGEYPEKQKTGKSTDTDPHGRSEGPTKVSKLSEEDPDNLDVVVDLPSVKNNKTSRVLHQSSADKRAPLKGGPIADHAEGGEADTDGIVRQTKAAKTSTGKSPRGRQDGPTDFPTRSEEDPDDMEMAVNVKDATQSDKIRIVRQKSGDKPSVDHAEEGMPRRKKEAAVKDVYTPTGKGSTYRESTKKHTEASSDQAPAPGFPERAFKELEALKKENDRLKKEFEEHKMRSCKKQIAQYVEGLYSEGKLTNSVIPQEDLQSFAEGLEFGTLEFAEGETPASKLFAILNRLPSMVHFGEIVGPEDKSFEPDLKNMDPHERALEMVRRGEASDYVEAIKICLWSSN